MPPLRACVSILVRMKIKRNGRNGELKIEEDKPKKENGKLASLLQMTEDQEHGNIGGADSGSPRG
jgi:hypothetical protein